MGTASGAVRLGAPGWSLPAALAARFRVEAVLGEGGAGTVYRVRRDGVVRALKVLHPHVLADPRMVCRFKLEGTILRELSHPNVLRVLEVGSDPACPYLLCEYVDEWACRR